MRKFSVHEAQGQLSELLEAASAGEEFLIEQSGVSVARLVPVHLSKPMRQPGAMRSQIWMAPDFDAALPDEILGLFESR